MTFFPTNDKAKPWGYSSQSDKSYQSQVVYFLGHSDTYLFNLVRKKVKYKSKLQEEFFEKIDILRGTKVSSNVISDPKYTIQTISGFEGDGGEFHLFGQYYALGADINKAKSLGFFTYKLDESGYVISRKYLAWDEDIIKHFPIDAKGRKTVISDLFFHRFIRTDNRKVFLVAEEFSVDKGAKIAKGLDFSFAYNIGDLFVFEFEADFSLKGVKLIEKAPKESRQKAAPTRAAAAGKLLKAQGGFGYLFTQTDSENADNFSILYEDKEKGEKKPFLGNMNYVDGQGTLEKIPYDSKAKETYISKAKPGYILISEYFKKEKKMEWRLEKLNF